MNQAQLEALYNTMTEAETDLVDQIKGLPVAQQTVARLHFFVLDAIRLGIKAALAVEIEQDAPASLSVDEMFNDGLVYAKASEKNVPEFNMDAEVLKKLEPELLVSGWIDPENAKRILELARHGADYCNSEMVSADDYVKIINMIGHNR